MQFWVGGYSPDSGGTAEGIGVLTAGVDDSPFASGVLSFRAAARPPLMSPSWIASHPEQDVVYAALEGEGRVVALARTGVASFAVLGSPVEAGDGVCHIGVSPDGSYLLAACWGDGRVVRLALDGRGSPVGRVVAPAARDPYGVAGDDAVRGRPRAPVSGVGVPRVSEERGPRTVNAATVADAAAALRAAVGPEFVHLIPSYDRPAEPDVRGAAFLAPVRGAESPPRTSRAHAAAFLPDGRALTTDLGFDLVRVWRSHAGALVADHEVVLPRGCGPRHLLVHPSGFVYVLTEFSNEILVLGADRTGRWSLRASVAAAALALPGDTGAELAASHDHAFLYAGLRGSDTIAVLKVTGNGAGLEPVALTESGVTWPRHHLIVRDSLLVAGQRSGEVVSMALDLRTGVPGRVRHRTSVPSPTCLLVARD